VDAGHGVAWGKVLPIRASHITALAALPDLHRDPFDRILIAQAVTEGLPLVTSDRQIGAYPVRVIW
jgi:PIN domain nuclease of toxin-antitoxin system